MAVLKIRVYGDPVLRKTAEPVEEIDDEIRSLAADMLDTMYANGGIGLAAVQVGVPKRLFVADPLAGQEEADPRVFINPVIGNKEGSESLEEGCLSIPEVRADVRRASSFDFTALNLDGEIVKFRAEGLLGRVLLHEVDHLDGRLFIDYLSPVKRMLIKDQLKSLERQAIQEG